MTLLRALAAEVLEGIDATWDAWTSPHCAERARAVTATVGQLRYAPDDVQRQLAAVAARCRGSELAAQLLREVGERARGPWPVRVLHLAAGGVPGLLVESIAHQLATGGRAIPRPSRDDTVTQHWLDVLAHAAPGLRARVELVEPGGDLPWREAHAAVVFGGDDTIAAVRAHLGADVPVAAYGSREAVALLDAGDVADGGPGPQQLDRLADDVLTFAQRGCMSPRQLLVSGEPGGEQRARLVRELDAALQAAAARHLAASPEPAAIHGRDRFAERRARDEHELDLLLAPRGDRGELLTCGPASLELHWLAGEDEVARHVRELGSRRQTAVLVSPDARIRARLARCAVAAGCSRTCAAGQAHFPPADWPHDGIGWYAPLVPGARHA